MALAAVMLTCIRRVCFPRSNIATAAHHMIKGKTRRRVSRRHKESQAKVQHHFHCIEESYKRPQKHNTHRMISSHTHDRSISSTASSEKEKARTPRHDRSRHARSCCLSLTHSPRPSQPSLPGLGLGRTLLPLLAVVFVLDLLRSPASNEKRVISIVAEPDVESDISAEKDSISCRTCCGEK